MQMTLVYTALMAVLLAFSDDAMAAARTALACFGTGVLPALMPMMILGKLMPNTTKPEHSSRRLWAGCVFFGFAAGSPAAAQRAAEVKNRFSGSAWERLLCLSGVMSPMFFTGTLAGWLRSARDGWILLIVHWLGAGVCAAVWTFFIKPDASAPDVHPLTPAPARPRLPEIISRCAQSLLCVLGAMMTFSVAASLIKNMLSVMFPAWTAQHADWMAVLWAVMEIGGGASAVISEMAAPYAALSALCGFGGLSIFLQNMLFLDQKIRPARLLAMRAVHGAACYAIVRLLKPF